ncbi:MAG: S53 family peptidase, partial [Actinomycetales bacterium]
TTLNLYRHNGKARRAPATPAQVPASLGNVVLSVGGLTDTTGAIHPNTKSPEGTQKPVQVQTPCSNYYGQYSVSNLPNYAGLGTTYPTSTCGYVPSQVRGAYGLQPGGQTGGSGVTVAIIDAYALPTMEQDANSYSANHGLPSVSGLYSEYKPGAFALQDECGETGWWGEEALDVEAVHSMAPSAKIAYVPSASCDDTDFFDAYSRILEPSAGAKAPLASIVSNSYGDTSDVLPGDLNEQTHTYFVKAAAEGVGFYFSSGDDGDAAADNSGVPQPQASANDPLVTAVGGTTLGVRANDTYGFETGWGNERSYLVKDAKTKQLSWAEPFTFYAGAGGGASARWDEPSYQKGAGIQGDVTHPVSTPSFTGRVVPDIAAVADPYTGFLVGYNDGTGYLEGSIGGTSLACPVIAGVMANAQAIAHKTIGFANPVLYRMPGSAFHDVQPPAKAEQKAVVYYSPGAQLTRIVLSDHDSSLQTTSGYDNVTGLGSPSATFISSLRTALR